MIHLNLAACNMFKLLQERSANSLDAALLAGQLLSIENEVARMLEYVTVKFPEFPDHGIQHSLRILNYVSSILDDHIKENISDVEIFCFIMAALFHDTGMVLSDIADKTDQRKNHHLYSCKALDTIFDKNLNNLKERRRLKKCIQFVCEAHGEDIDELYHSGMLEEMETIDGQPLRYGLLAILLRIGDLMDIEETRVCELNMCLNPAYYGNRVSAEHNRKYIEDDISYSYTCERIHIRVSVDNRERYKMWAQWLKYLNNEIMYANTHYLVEQNSKFFQNYKLPRADVEVKPKTDAKFTVEEIKFQVDDSGALWNILTNSIYTDRFDFVRELIQNAIDAVLLKTYLNRTIELSYQSPRVWKCRDEVVIAYSQDEGVLLVQDTGVGMNESELSTYLFKTANSGYKQKEQREFVFPAIAKFGIGFVACLTKADNIQILTCTEDGNGLKAEIDDNQSLAFIERENNQKVQGTGILLKLRYKYLFSELKEYIDETFVYPSVSIKLINLDQMRRYETSMPTLEGTEWRFELDKIEARIITQHRRVMAEWRHSRKKRKEFEGYKPVVHRITNHEMGRVADYSYLVLQMDPNLKVGRVYKDSKICKESQGLIFVSTNYMDYEFGVEWRSVNAFIFAENRIRKNLLNYFIVDDDEDESDVISLDSLTDIEYEMSMLLETDEAVDYYEKNFRDASIESEMDTEKYFYDVIVQLKNDFYQFFSIGMEELEGIEEQYEVESKDRLRSSLSLPSEYQDEPFDFGASKLYQDGIKMKLDPQCIVPIGVGYVQANLTASARLELNITRHEVSQNQDMIEKWCDEVGKKIQRKVVENCIHIFKENELEFDMKSLLAERPGDGIMEKICYDNIKQIIRECEDGK